MKKIVIGCVAGLVVLAGGMSVSYSLGNSRASIELDKEKVKYEELTKKISDKKSELAQLSDKTIEVNKNLKDKQSEFDNAKEILDSKKENEKKIDDLKNKIKSSKDELKQIKSNIDDKNDELASVEGEVEKAKAAPKTLGAGSFTVGSDLPEGRYKAEAAGESGNFIVHSILGDLKVNTVLGSGWESEYTFNAEDGDEMELSTSIKFTKIDK
ncbi:hypothetical protein J7E26_15640 [Bacillus sp. ISL-51]|uniref:hypothetical protein n=1 Tax=Bacteria TaxID=2 RepID=UPI001BEC7873|nr:MULTISPECIES: hypothetical protein [Bacteria]MBT2575358.1 hypothetical protein [Bacillus sp. ISL-51]MBT2712995.1 hypothetical protein [Pseudomonas sp. ISL-88]